MLDDVFRRLADPEFQNIGTGLMSFPAYVYVYPPGQEREFREAISRLPSRLRRPNVGQDPLLVNIFEELLEFLKEQTLGGRPLLSHILEKDKEDPEVAKDQLKSQAQSDEFTQRMAKRFEEHVSGGEASGESDLDRSYVLIHGWGEIYPYLRSSRFLDQLEKGIGDYKIILFYPGSYENGQFRLFGILSSNRVYRASYFNEMIGDA